MLSASLNTHTHTHACTHTHTHTRCWYVFLYSHTIEYLGHQVTIYTKWEFLDDLGTPYPHALKPSC